MGIIEMKNVCYSYDGRQNVLQNVSVSFEEGKLYAILGPSGCGKTTLLSLLGGLDRQTAGSICYQGKELETAALARHRKRHVSFVFQSYNLIDYMTPRENVALVSKLPPQPILEKTGLTQEECRRNVLRLSGGQQQRVAIARALAGDAPVILADEPTGNLDEETALEIMALLKDAAHRLGKCVVIVTHSRELARDADCSLRLRKGRIQRITSC